MADNWLSEEYIPFTDAFSPKDIYPFVFNFTAGGPGAKCFKRFFIIENKLEFLGIQKSEDFYFIHLGIAKASRIAVIRRPLYFIRDVQTSLEHQKDKMPLVFWDAVELLKVRLEEEGIYEFVKQSFLNSCVNRFAYNLHTMKTEEGTDTVLKKLRQVGEKELGLGLLPVGYYYQKDNYLYLCRQLGLSSVLVFTEKNMSMLMDEATLIRTSWSYRIGRFITFAPRKVHNGFQCYRDHGTGYTIRRTLYHMGLWEDEEAPKGPENHPKLIKHAERLLKGKRK